MYGFVSRAIANLGKVINWVYDIPNDVIVPTTYISHSNVNIIFLQLVIAQCKVFYNNYNNCATWLYFQHRWYSIQFIYIIKQNPIKKRNKVFIIRFFL